MTDTDTTEGETPDATRLDRVEQAQQEQGSKLDALIETVNKIIPGSHAEAEQRTERHLDRKSAVAEEVKAELEKAKQEEARAKAADDEKSEREQIRADLAKLQETAPAPPVPRRTRMLGWGDGR
jgi:septal ring factor EnvC (AmiA/AmiB activator)